ncbi:MAG: hypothetical protein Q9221_006571 [Calogaya cf. arnoldii]
MPCPYCQKKHRHGTGISDLHSDLTGQSRVSHCCPRLAGSDEYRLHFPFEDETELTSWEIEKDEGNFITVGLPMHTSYDEDDWASISDDGMPTFCKTDNEDAKGEGLVERSSLTDHFNELSLDPQQPQSPAAVPPPLSTGQDWEEMMQDQEFRLSVYVSNCILNDRCGISALMTRYEDDFLAMTDPTGNNGIALAAAEGHLRLLQWLHEQGYLALPDRRNINERKRRMILWHEPPEADQHRHHIATQLRCIPGTILPAIHGPASEKQQSTTGLFLEPKLSSQTNTIDYYELDQRYLIPDVHKAIGRLDRGPLFPVISSMSGYSHSDWDPLTVLDNAKWTAEVMKLGQRLNIPVGQSYASHVEKQLLAYYVSKHVLLDDEHMELQKVKPPGLPIEATILVSKDEVCQDCKFFIRRLLELVPTRVKVKCIRH